MRFVLSLVLSLAMPSVTAAQTLMPRQDAAITIGWAGTEDAGAGDQYWRSRMAVSAGVGRYWTDHIKTDVDAAWHSRSSYERYGEMQIDQARVFARSIHRVGETRVSVAQTYQFGRNEWVHPYLGLGTDIVRRLSVLDRPAQTAHELTQPASRAPRQVVISEQIERSTQIVVSPFLKAGLKMYSSERTFFITEIKLGFASDFEQALWTLGIGFDF